VCYRATSHAGHFGRTVLSSCPCMVTSVLAFLRPIYVVRERYYSCCIVKQSLALFVKRVSLISLFVVVVWYVYVRTPAVQTCALSSNGIYIYIDISCQICFVALDMISDSANNCVDPKSISWEWETTSIGRSSNEFRPGRGPYIHTYHHL
jgi:hypothetical protein